MDIRFRPFVWSDIEGIARLHRAAEQVDHVGRNGEAISLAQRWRRPGTDPEQTCLVAHGSGMVLGYALRTLVHGTYECVLEGVVHPAWRRRGIGRGLVERAVVEAGSAGAHSVDLRVREDELPGAEFSRALGFACARVWQRMWLEPLRVLAFGFPGGYHWRAFRPHADEATYAEVVTDTLAGQWGTGPITAERVAQMVRQPDFDPANHLFATCARGVVGVCSARFVQRTVGGREFSVAHLGPIGVRAEHRRRGVARALVATSLRGCRQRRIQAAELDVDAQNTAAIRVYRDCGMETRLRILWYRRELPQAE